jgi:cytochrome c556
MRSRQFRVVFLGAVAATMVAAPVLAAAADVVRARIEGLRELGALYKNVNDELKSDTPNKMILMISARQINDAARDQYKWFPAGSGPQPGVKTKAKPEIWAKGAQFKAAQDNFAKQAAAFNKAVSAGDVAKMRAQAKVLGGTCGGCHRTFRAETT